MSAKHHKQCKYCGKIIPAKNIRKEFCDDRCRKAYHRKLKIEEAEKQALAEAEKNRPLSAEEQELSAIPQQIEDKKKEIAQLEQTLSFTEKEVAERKKKQDGMALTRNKICSILLELEREHGSVISGKRWKERYFANDEETRQRMLNKFNPPLQHINQMNDNTQVKLNCSEDIGEFEELLEKCNEELRKANQFFTRAGMRERIAPEPKLAQRKILAFPIAEKEQVTYFIPLNKITNLKIKIEYLNDEIKRLEEKEQQLKQSIESNKKSKNLEDIKDELGFVPAREIKNINFGSRIQLDGDIGIFLGRLERKRCAITLSGEQGSGKTYLCFDIAGAFIDKGYSVAYFSLEEGISDIVKEKLRHYKLENVNHLHFAETGGLKQIQQAAEKLDVVIIDSWGKLNTPIEEFDKLRINYPGTFFIVIFQLTTSGHLRGGTKAGYDSSANIEVFKKEDKRWAKFEKNRYGRTDLVYSVDERRLTETAI